MDSLAAQLLALYRNTTPVSDKLRDRLHDGLVARGYSVAASADTPEAFGSWYVDYLRSDRQLRLIWDGRDQWFVLQGGTPWSDLAIKRPDELAGAGLDDFLAHSG